MNDKIKQLAEQATDSISYRVCQNTYKEVDDPAGPFVRKEFNKEKFAELIVKECAEISKQSQWSEAKGEYYEGFNEAMIYVSNKIKEHFGVEQ